MPRGASVGRDNDPLGADIPHWLVGKDDDRTGDTRKGHVLGACPSAHASGTEGNVAQGTQKKMGSPPDQPRGEEGGSGALMLLLSDPPPPGGGEFGPRPPTTTQRHNQSNKSQNPSQTPDPKNAHPRGGGGGGAWWPKMLEFGANPPTHLCTQAPPPPKPTKQ